MSTELIRTNWAPGDLITSEYLNGVGDAINTLNESLISLNQANTKNLVILKDGQELEEIFNPDNELEAGTTIILLPNKIYTINEPIEITVTNISIIALGGTSYLPIIKSKENYTEEYLFNVQRPGIVFQGINFEGDFICKGIKFETADIDSKIINCRFKKFHTGVTAKGRNVDFQNCGFSNCLIGIEFQNYGSNYSQGWIVNECRFHSMGQGWAAIREDNDPVEYNFEGNLYYGHAKGNTTLDVIRDGYNTIDTFPAWCITALNTTGSQILGIYITNNIVDGAGYSGFYKGTSEYLELSNNKILAGNKNWILAYCINGETNRGYTGNIFNNFCVANATSNSILNLTNLSPIYLEDKLQVNIYNNFFSNYGGSGIQIIQGSSAAVIIIANNIFSRIARAQTDAMIEISNLPDTNNTGRYITAYNNYCRTYANVSVTNNGNINLKTPTLTNIIEQ